MYYEFPLKKKFTSFILVLSLFFLLNISMNPFPLIECTSYLPHELHAKLTGNGAVSDTLAYDVYGTDLGIIMKHNSKYHYIFGDTFGNISGLNWRSNTIAYSTDTDPSDGIYFDGWILHPPTGFAKELIPSKKVDNDEMTCIPTTALSHEGIIYIFYMSVRHWGAIGGVWTCNNASIAVSVDNGQNFIKMTNISWSGDSHFVQFGFAQNQLVADLDDGYFYFLATPSGRYGACYLCRVPQNSLLNQLSYSYYTGKNLSDDPIWSNDYSEAVSIFPAYVGELSVMWNDYLQKWTAFYFDNFNLDIVLRTADFLWGPWSNPFAIVGADECPSLYGSFVHPDFVENNGETVYFIMSKFNVYNTFVLSVNLESLLTTSFSLSNVQPILTICSVLIVVFYISSIHKEKQK